MEKPWRNAATNGLYPEKPLSQGQQYFKHISFAIYVYTVSLTTHALLQGFTRNAYKKNPHSNKFTLRVES